MKIALEICSCLLESLAASSKFLPPTTPLFCRLLSSEAMASFTCIKVEEAKPFVYNVQFNRPEKRNAFSRTHWE